MIVFESTRGDSQFSVLNNVRFVKPITTVCVTVVTTSATCSKPLIKKYSYADTFVVQLFSHNRLVNFSVAVQKIVISFPKQLMLQNAVTIHIVDRRES